MPKSEYIQKFNEFNFATIDPGITTAIQFWRMGELDGKCKVHRIKKKKNEDRTFHSDIDTLTIGMNFSNVDFVLIEAVDFRATSSVSLASASRGNLSLLAYIVGAIAHRAIIDGATVLDPVRFGIWAGQLSYTQLRKYLRTIKIDTKNEHESAAIGIGLWAKGEL